MILLRLRFSCLIVYLDVNDYAGLNGNIRCRRISLRWCGKVKWNKGVN